MSWYSEILLWAESVDKKWQTQKDKMTFSDFAYQELQGHSFHKDFDLHRDMKEILEHRIFPTQINPNSNFGDPPITLYFSSDQSFYLDMYIWMETQTSIHEHSFEGAFTVLQGRSIESKYEFNTDLKLDDGFLGTLHKKGLSQILPGHVEIIPKGKQLIHRVLHITKPTVSLILRTHNKVHASNINIQYRYDFDKLASNSHPPGDVVAKMRALRWYLSSGQTPTFSMVKPLLSYYDLWETLSRFPQAAVLINKMAALYSDISFVTNIHSQKMFHSLLISLQTEDEKILLTAYEYFGDDWGQWLKENLDLNESEARTKLVSALVSISWFHDHLKNGPLLKGLFQSTAETV